MILEQHDSVMLPVLLLLFSFGKLCDEWSEDQEVTDELEAFTCLIYGYVRVKSVSTVKLVSNWFIIKSLSSKILNCVIIYKLQI